MTEVGPSETYSPTSNDLMLLLTSSHLQHALAYGTIAQTDSDVQDVQNSPAISMGPYLIISGQTDLLRSTLQTSTFQASQLDSRRPYEPRAQM